MGWSTLCLRHGLRLDSQLVVSGQAALAIAALSNDEKKGLRLMDLSPTLKNSEQGHFGSKYESMDEETYDRCCEAEGCFLLYYMDTTLVLDGSNGIKVDSNRCYGGGHLEFLRGDYDVEPLTEAQTKALTAVATKLGVEFKLMFSMVATGSGASRVSTRFDTPEETKPNAST